MCLCTTCMPGARTRLKKASDPQEMELQMAASCCVGAEPRSCGRAANVLSCDLSLQPGWGFFCFLFYLGGFVFRVCLGQSHGVQAGLKLAIYTRIHICIPSYPRVTLNFLPPGSWDCSQAPLHLTSFSVGDATPGHHECYEMLRKHPATELAQCACVCLCMRTHNSKPGF